MPMPASCVFDLDARVPASYPGTGQVWKNLIALPADGAVQTAYDFNLGNSSGVAANDPAFQVSPPAWTLAGAQFFTLASGAGGPAFLSNLHREDAGNLTTFVIQFHYVASAHLQVLLGNSSSSSTNHAGFRLMISTAGVLQFLRNTGDAASTNNTKSTGITLVTDTDYVLAFTFNSATLAYKASINGASFSDVGSAVSLGNNTHAAVDTTTLCANNAQTTAALEAGSRVKACSMYNAILSDAQLAAVVAVYAERDIIIGVLAGTAAEAQAGIGTLRGAGALAGTAAQTEAASGELRGAGALAGEAALVIDAAGTLRGAGALAGTAGIALAASGTLTNVALLPVHAIARHSNSRTYGERHTYSAPTLRRTTSRTYDERCTVSR